MSNDVETVIRRVQTPEGRGGLGGRRSPGLPEDASQSMRAAAAAVVSDQALLVLLAAARARSRGQEPGVEFAPRGELRAVSELSRADPAMQAQALVEALEALWPQLDDETALGLRYVVEGLALRRFGAPAPECPGIRLALPR